MKHWFVSFTQKGFGLQKKILCNILFGRLKITPMIQLGEWGLPKNDDDDNILRMTIVMMILILVMTLMMIALAMMIMVMMALVRITVVMMMTGMGQIIMAGWVCGCGVSQGD